MPSILRRALVSAWLLCALTVTGMVPVNAVAAPQASHLSDAHARMRTVAVTIKKHTHKQDALCRKANELRRLVIKKQGKRAPGRDICQFGMTNGKRPTKQQKLNYKLTLHRMAYPPPVVVIPATAPTPTSPTATTSSAPTNTGPATPSSSSLPGCASESGTNYSTGPENTNPTTGATGRYQELPMHRQPGGLCYGIDLSPGGQDRCASIIYGAQGAGAWVGCGG
jgi:hypothetical protein